LNELDPRTPDPGAQVLALMAPWATESPPRGAAGAAVLIVLRAGRREVETLLMERTVRPDDLASGQVSLPGGRVQDSDGELADTALRESAEEVGVGAGDLLERPKFVRFADASVFSLRVGVFVARLGPVSPPPVPAGHTEVAHVFWLPKSALHHSRPVLRDTVAGPKDVEAIVYDGHVVWGFTRRILLDFFAAVHLD
jgi:8-oxo-dGTP pyrophosphatase MutT (NUDIX family)